jgi:protein TonB
MKTNLARESTQREARPEHQLRVINREEANPFSHPVMFQDVLLDSASTVKSRRGMSTAFSFLIQVVIVAVVVIIPLLITQALPTKALTTMLVAPPPPPPPPPPPSATKAVQTATPVVKANAVNLDQLRTPTKIPNKIDTRPEQPAAAAPPPSMAGIAGGVPGGVAGGQIGGVVGGVVGSVGNYMPSKPPSPQRVRVSQGVTQGLLVKKVEPQYPPIARQARVQGSVVLQALIAKDGSIQHLQATSGSPLLVSAAIQAVQQWKYKPYVLNGQPVEIETTITVNFHLS